VFIVSCDCSTQRVRWLGKMLFFSFFFSFLSGLFIDAVLSMAKTFGVILICRYRARRSNYREQGRILCFVDRASLYNLFQMKPTRCTLLLSIFISTSLHVSGNNVLVGMMSHPNEQTRQPTTQSEKYKCRIDTVSSPDDWHIVARNM